MKRKIDINSWNRREHYYHFKQFDDPFFGVTVNIDVSNLYLVAKEREESLFINYFYQIMCAVNGVESFKYRIEDEGVVCYDAIHASSTIGRDDGTFAFCSFDFNSSFRIFKEKCEKEIKRVNNSDGLRVNKETSRQDIIHYSPNPWFQFTEMKHPVSLSKENSIPKISSGKIFEESGKMLMPLSISANHALMDGYHIAEFIEILNQNILLMK